ncbi:hypothetical protein [Chitinimonas sp. BJB300]|uniref:hypothetical protein n=1 Tax=Chitinimonas sp. BJB300 TaxID=1559339 RepID=UPI001304003A|nr:hypothetical protein [Chitinimonas sp. BJB300]
MKSPPKQPGEQPSRPSLYKPDSTSSFSILDAATVQGGQKRAKTTPTAEAPPRRIWPWVVAIMVLAIVVGGILLVTFTTHDAESPVITHTPTAVVNTPAAPIAVPVEVPLSAPAIKLEMDKPAVVEQMEPPHKEMAPATAVDPLTILEADNSKPQPAPPPKAAAMPPAAKAASNTAAKPSPAKAGGAKQRETRIDPDKSPAKAQHDMDVDFMEAVLSRMPKPAQRNEPKSEPKQESKSEPKQEAKPEPAAEAKPEAKPETP